MKGLFKNLFKGKKTEIYFEKDISPDKSRKIKKDINENIKILNEEYFIDCDDVIVREFQVVDASGKKHKLAVVWIDGLVDKNLIQEHVIKALMIFARNRAIFHTAENFLEQVKESLITVADLKESDNFGEAVLAVLSGDTVLFIDKAEKNLIISSRGWEKRGIQEPSTEAVIHGPKDGFTETFRVNVAQVRRRIKDPNLKVKTIRLGRHTRTDVAILFIQGIANPKIVEEFLKRLDKVDVEGILDAGYLEQYIEDSWVSPFPLFRRTERPDVATAALLEGCVVLITDNTPYALIAPVTFWSLFHSAEDYYERWQIAALIRHLRFIAIFTATSAPAFYVAFVSYHPGLLPTDLALSIGATREGVPFSATIEALIMMIALELLREAGVRLPGPIGQTIGIVGGLIIGEAAVRAGIVSPIMVIIIAVNAISSFAIPSYSVAIGFRLLTFIFLILSSIAGLYGITIGYIWLTLYLSTLKSFGANYLDPFVNLDPEKMEDLIVRFPLRYMTKRPDFTHPLDETTLNKDLISKIPSGDEDVDG